MPKPKKKNVNPVDQVSRQVKAYPNGYYRRYLEAYARFHEDSVSRVVCYALKEFIDKIPEAEKNKMLKAAGMATAGKRQSKNNY